MSKKRTSGIYKALLTQAGVADPTSIELENTLLPGTAPVVWTRFAVGSYTGTLVGAFADNKTVYNVSITGGRGTIDLDRDVTNNTVILQTFNTADALADGLLTDGYVMIEVFK